MADQTVTINEVEYKVEDLKQYSVKKVQPLIANLFVVSFNSQ